MGLPDREITGGNAYDALIAATAAMNKVRLVSCDRRAVPVYERYGVQYDLIST